MGITRQKSGLNLIGPENLQLLRFFPRSFSGKAYHFGTFTICPSEKPTFVRTPHACPRFFPSTLPVGAPDQRAGGLGSVKRFPSQALRQRYEKLGATTRQELTVAVTRWMAPDNGEGGMVTPSYPLVIDEWFMVLYGDFYGDLWWFIWCYMVINGELMVIDGWFFMGFIGIFFFNGI